MFGKVLSGTATLGKSRSGRRSGLKAGGKAARRGRPPGRREERQRRPGRAGVSSRGRAAPGRGEPRGRCAAPSAPLRLRLRLLQPLEAVRLPRALPREKQQGAAELTTAARAVPRTERCQALGASLLGTDHLPNRFLFPLSPLNWFCSSGSCCDFPR